MTAEKVFQGIYDYEVRSAGTENNARVKVTSGHIGWADLIFVMEKKHVRRLQERFGDLLSQKKIVCLNIPDDFQFMDDELIEILIASVSQHIELPIVFDRLS
ncbi:protein tyrosine phosphatase [Anaerospora sp.]|uniref:low molecular weight protein tyrosine phosphatase family protein n=1 Tax=Anaerospora sp. TaxID=1960278 RepID=UPI00289AAB68|nr:protein tyrosine phosphatase [Anaerospora sp.]